MGVSSINDVLRVFLSTAMPLYSTLVNNIVVAGSGTKTSSLKVFT